MSMSRTAVTTLSRTSAIIILILLAIFASYPVWAKESTSSGITRKEAALKAKLQTFRDLKKASAAARINDNLNRINDKQTQQMLKHLDKMSTILGKLETRVNQGTAAIASAGASIASASAVVRAQSEKDYTIQVTSESTVKQDAQNTRTKLHTDLQTVRKLVIDAKQAVANAIRKEGIPSGQ